jgi:DNA-binding transcriptional LysR family regulator
MELRQLRSFVAVAEELHFRRAADRLHLAQPSVSPQIRALEAELGVPLFERSRRRVALTLAGSALLEEARDLLGRAEQAATVTRAIGAGERGRLRMSLTRSLTGGVAGEIVAAYRSRYQEVDLVLSLGTTMVQVEQLYAGEIDRPGRSDELGAPRARTASATQQPSSPRPGYPPRPSCLRSRSRRPDRRS